MVGSSPERPTHSPNAAGSMAAAMDVQNALPAIKVSVAEFYAGKVIFITGGTGFMGKVLLEKLLRSCPGVAKIYLLIRPKKGQSPHDRLQQLLFSPLFDQLRKERPGDLGKVAPIEGDITEPLLAISTQDRDVLCRTVNVVFHSAATIKFDEKLKLSVTINMLGTQWLVELCKKMPNLEAMVHVSTAYCNCDRRDVKETIYPPPLGPEQVTQLVETLDERLLDGITPKLIGRRPNTYTFTKALAESWLKENKGDLPLVIVRPSIVLSTMHGPMKGWLDNWNGPTGIIAAAGKGIFRTMNVMPHKVADFIPVDVVINLMLVSAWRMGNCKTKEIQVYNCSSGTQMPITWHRFVELCFRYMRRYPFSDVTWYPDGTVTTSYALHSTLKALLQLLPAYVMDAFLWISGKKPYMVNIQSKLSKASECLNYFTTHDWNFDNSNVRQLALTLSEADRQDFCFDIAQLNWEEFIENYVLGIRRFIFKEDMSTLPKARRRVAWLLWAHRAVKLLLVMSLWRFLAARCEPLRRLWVAALSFLLHVTRTALPFL